MTTRKTGGLLRAISPCYRPAPKDAGFHFRSSHYALDSSPPFKGRSYYRLPLEGVLVLLHTEFILHDIVLLLVLYILFYGCLIKSYRTYIVPF